MRCHQRILVFIGLIISSLPGFADEITCDQARSVALNWLVYARQIYHDWDDASPPTIQAEEVVLDEGQVVGYNFLIAPQGHILVPSRDELPPVKLYSDTMNLSFQTPSAVTRWLIEDEFRPLYQFLDSVAEVPAIEMTLNSQLWTRFQQAPAAFLEEMQFDNINKENLSVGPLLRTTWGQYHPYNLQTPWWRDEIRTVTGCVATAAAQILAYWHYPSRGSGSTSYQWFNGLANISLSQNFSDRTYDWANICDVYRGNEPYEQQQAVATLLLDVGLAFHTNYGPGPYEGPNGRGSSAEPARATLVFPQYFRYKNSVQFVWRHDYFDEASWMQMFRNEVSAGRPCLFTGYHDTETGHVMVVDGYRDAPITQLHLNFGWDGGSDGWYVSNDISTGEYHWNSKRSAVIGLEPEVLPPSPLSPIDHVCTLTPTYHWQSSNGATSYCVHVTIADTTSPQTQCYSPEEACCPGGVGTCSVMPDDIVLTDTYYTWQVEARNEVGSAWSQSMDFTVPLLPAMQIAPSGVINTDSPTYAWQAVEGATEYRLEVTAAAQTPVFFAWYPAQDLGCASGGVCAVTPEGVLPEDNYFWRTLSMNGVCDDQSTFWNDGEGFTVTLSPFPTPTPNPTPLSDSYLLWTD